MTAVGVADTAARGHGNVVPGAYRGVAVSTVECDLDEEHLRAHFTGLDAYRRTRFIVARRGDQCAVLAVDKASEQPLFAPITRVDLLAGPQECAYLRCPDVDTAVPTALAAAALREAPGARAVVVEGRYAHVNFILDPHPLQLTVREVVPPHPAKLVDQVQRVLDVSEELPPMVLLPEVVDLSDLAAGEPADAYLLPCRGGGATVGAATISYLDEHPPRPDSGDWVLVGCERSQQIHTWFYGEQARQVDFCPRRRVGGAGGAVLAKCCLLELEIAEDEDCVVVPWGASLGQVAQALAVVARRWDPAWAPA